MTAGDANGGHYEAFLAGDRTGVVRIYLHEAGVGSTEDLLEIGEPESAATSAGPSTRISR